MPIRHAIACLILLAASTLGAAADLVAPRPQPGPVAVLTLAEQPLRLIRGVAVFKAGAGVALQPEDILETGAGGAQLEGAGLIIALGAQTRVLLASPGGDARSPVERDAIELHLLQGWAKLQVTGRRALVVTPALRITMPAAAQGGQAPGATIVHAGDQDAVFAEEGEQQVARIDAQGRPGTPLKLAAEQYAALDPGKPQAVAGRPPRSFVAGMPAAFRDRLVRVPVLPGAGKALPVKERDADFADVKAWLAAPLPARRRFTIRFKPRLADPAFRAQLDRLLGQGPDWKPLLHPVRPSAPHQESTS